MNNTQIDKGNKFNLSMKSDFVFKGVFSKPGNEDVLIDFLESILNIDIKNIDVLRDVTLEKEAKENKYGVLDLRATLNDDTFVIVEMQVKKDPDMPFRMSFYTGKTFTLQAKRGDTYNSLRKVYGICICDYKFTPYEEYKAEYATINKKHREDMLNNGIESIYIELPKFRKEKDLDYDNKQTQWLLFIDGENKKGVEIAMKKNEKIRKAYITKKYLTGDDKYRAIADLRQKSEMDYNSRMKRDLEEGIKNGIAQGIEQGIEQEKINTAREMLNEGFDIEKISKITKLPINIIESLKN